MHRNLSIEFQLNKSLEFPKLENSLVVGMRIMISHLFLHTLWKSSILTMPLDDSKKADRKTNFVTVPSQFMPKKLTDQDLGGWGQKIIFFHQFFVIIEVPPWDQNLIWVGEDTMKFFHSMINFYLENVLEIHFFIKWFIDQSLCIK